MNLKIGQKISHYELVQKMGAGGMGIVYKARDLKLDRYAALKFLPSEYLTKSEEKERFILEAKTTSGLDHPNICTIYEIDELNTGQIFISMACYEGEVLREKIEQGPFSVQDAVHTTIQIAEGLNKAHENGIVHRDIKPDNIIVTEDGVVKILDFGIAKLKGSTQITKPGTVMGTPGYMSPEQTLGETVDHQTDIWSTGVILYQMLTGELPFKGDNDLALMYAIVNEEPIPITSIRQNISRELQSIVSKALNKDLTSRYQYISDMTADLKSIGQKSVGATKTQIVPIQQKQLPSIAVLPFEDMSPGKDQEYFSDGLSEEIINTLVKVEGLKVVSRNTAFQFKDKHVDATQVGRELNVQSILEGSIRKAGNRLRISIRLINISDGFLRWTENYERELQDIFAIQDEIAREVVRNLQVKLVGESHEGLIKKYTDNVDAYNAYLKGRYYWNKRTVENLQKSIGHYNEAINIDPNYALAYAGLADTYTILGIYGARPPLEVMPKAMQAAQKALQIDDNLAEARVSLGCLHAVHNWNWQSAELEFKKGIELNPDYPIAHHWYAINYLVPMGRFDDAVVEILKALHLDPVSMVINTTVGITYYFARQYKTATVYHTKALEMDPNFAMTQKKCCSN